MPEILKIVRGTKSNINEDINDENIPQKEINEVVLVHCSIAINNY